MVVLLASEEASRSPWIEREISYWREHKDPARILPVVTGGEWVWDEKAADFDWAASTAVPAALAGVFVSEPRHLDLRWARAEEQLDLRNGLFRGNVADLAATIRGVPKDDLEGEEVRQHRRTLRWAWGAAVALVLLTLLSAGTAVAAVRNADEAQRNESAAIAAQAQADANATEADANATEADANAVEAQSNAERARQAQVQADTTNEADAQHRKEEAAANAARAEMNASQAALAQAEPDANASSAETSAEDARANAERARLAQSESDRNAAMFVVRRRPLFTREIRGRRDQTVTTPDGSDARLGLNDPSLRRLLRRRGHSSDTPRERIPT